MVSTRRSKRTVNVPVPIPKAVPVTQEVRKAVTRAAKRAAKQVIRKVNNNSNNNSNNNASNNNNNNKSNKKPKRVYVCGTKCKDQKRRIAKTKGYPFNVWRQAEKKTSPWKLKNALKAFDNAYNRKKLLQAKWRIDPMPAKNRRKRVRKTKAKA